VHRTDHNARSTCSDGYACKAAPEAPRQINWIESEHAFRIIDKDGSAFVANYPTLQDAQSALSELEIEETINIIIGQRDEARATAAKLAEALHRASIYLSETDDASDCEIKAICDAALAQFEKGAH
jgi:hypothetical protein